MNARGAHVFAAHIAVIALVRQRPVAGVAEALVVADIVDAEGVGVAGVRASTTLVTAQRKMADGTSAAIRQML